MKKPHGKKNNLVAKTMALSKKKKTCRKRNILHGKNKKTRGKKNNLKAKIIALWSR